MPRRSREKQHQGPSRRIALILEYEGTDYQGFQLQARGPTIQGEVERALEQFTGVKNRIRGASRTDSGAHAKGQVVDFLTNAPYTINTFVNALNDSLPPQVKVTGAYEVPLAFNSRRDALSRVYCYTILNSPYPSPLLRNYAYWVRKPLNVGAMLEEARSLVGRHNFSPFTLKLPPGRSAMRHVTRWHVWQEGTLVFIEAEANSYLPHQVRKCNRLLVEIGLGKWPPGKVSQVLNGIPEESKQIPLLPAKGLCLMKVNYPDFLPVSDGAK